MTHVECFVLLCYYYYYFDSCQSLFSQVLLLNQRRSPPLRFQFSHCSTFRIMCDVPSIAVFCTESIECLLLKPEQQYSPSIEASQ
jgi:hypothetical protein